MIQFKYAYDVNKKNRSGILEAKLSSTSRKTYKVSRQDIRFSNSVEVEGKNLSFKGLKARKKPGVSQLMVSKSRILHGFFYKNSMKDLEKQYRIRDYMEKYCDGESMSISSLLSVPKRSWGSQGIRREKKAVFVVRKKKDIQGFDYGNRIESIGCSRVRLTNLSEDFDLPTRIESIGCSRVRLTNLSEDFDLPTPVFKPRYVNYM
ncbi:hypothetical protein SteCoe_27730 [Stentor coeruleus]|uniref:Uncharacterized protein n=1 Tax=Stentor coeruleus TaxID=5963 RepID=A0A1R2BA48_9CILI|nr:hypothetical protein SteCoe_27730 [Stentor coeruleus]